jgi:hypothetical protein
MSVQKEEEEVKKGTESVLRTRGSASQVSKRIMVPVILVVRKVCIPCFKDCKNGQDTTDDEEHTAPQVVKVDERK